MSNQEAAMPTGHSIASSRFEEFRNPYLADTLSTYIGEIKVCLPAPSTAILELPQATVDCCVLLAGEMPDSLVAVLASGASLRMRLCPGRPITAGRWTVFPITVFRGINHILAIDNSAIVDQASVPFQVGGFAGRISAVLEFHRLGNRLIQIGSVPIGIDVLEGFAHAMCSLGVVFEKDAKSAKQALAEGDSWGANFYLECIEQEGISLTRMAKDLEPSVVASYRPRRIWEIVERSRFVFYMLARRRDVVIEFIVDPAISHHTVCEFACFIIDVLLHATAQVLKTGENTPEETKVVLRITFDHTSEQIVFVLADNGPGTPSTMRDRLFDPEFAAQDLMIGLGLWLSRRLAESVGGTLRLIESQEPGGTRFMLTLPSKPSTNENS